MNLGPRWDPHAKTPKMEGVDFIYIEDDNEDDTQSGMGFVNCKCCQCLCHITLSSEKLLEMTVDMNVVFVKLR